MTMTVLNDNVVLRKLSAEEADHKTESGIILAQTSEDLRYVVVATGPGRRGLFDGKIVPNFVQPGWIVALVREPERLQLPGKNLFMVVESDIVAVVGDVGCKPGE